MSYFIVYTTDGTYYDMKRECNYVDFISDHLCVLSHKDEETNTTDALLMIPYSKISCIKKIKENENE